MEVLVMQQKQIRLIGLDEDDRILEVIRWYQ